MFKRMPKTIAQALTPFAVIRVDLRAVAAAEAARMTEATARVVQAEKDLADLRKVAEAEIDAAGAEVQQAQTALGALAGGK